MYIYEFVCLYEFYFYQFLEFLINLRIKNIINLQFLYYIIINDFNQIIEILLNDYICIDFRRHLFFNY